MEHELNHSSSSSGYNATVEFYHLGRVCDEPSASSGFFWPIEGFLEGVLALVTEREAAGGIREPN